MKTLSPASIDEIDKILLSNGKNSGLALRSYRESVGLSQTVFAKLIGVRSAVLSSWEYGAKKPSRRSIERVRKTLGTQETPEDPKRILIDELISNGKNSGFALRTYRESIGMSQTDFANLLGVKLKTLRAWEYGDKLSTRSIGIVCGTLGITKEVSDDPKRILTAELIDKGKNLGLALRAYRESIGMSQTDFAKLLGVRQTTLSSWECGEKQPKRSFELIRKLLGI